MSHKSPLALVKETFGDKSKLVEAIKKLGDGMWIPRVNEEKGLDHVSNAKLLRLHATFSEIKEKFGTREKLIEAVLEQQSRTKDVGLRTKLGLWPVPRLYDTYRSNAKRLSDAKSKAAPEKAKADPAKTKAAPAKAKVAQTKKS